MMVVDSIEEWASVRFGADQSDRSVLGRGSRQGCSSSSVFDYLYSITVSKAYSTIRFTLRRSTQART